MKLSSQYTPVEWTAYDLSLFDNRKSSCGPQPEVKSFQQTTIKVHMQINTMVGRFVLA